MKLYTLKNSFLVSCTALVLVISSCKKGEDDPAISLSSRKARVAGEWKLQSGHLAFGTKDGSGQHPSYTYDFSGSGYNLTTGKGGHFTGNSTLSMVFKRNGSYAIKQTLDTLSFEASGTWDFQGRVAKNKNKENLCMQMNSISGETNYYVLFNKSVNMFSYRIKELRKDKMVLVAEDDALGLDQTGNAIYVNAEYIFVY